MRVSAAIATAGALLLTTSAASAQLFGTDSLDPKFCQNNAYRQTVVYVDDMMMIDGRTEWATKLADKLRATLAPGERTTVVRMSPAEGASKELWSGCWPAYTEARTQPPQDPDNMVQPQSDRSTRRPAEILPPRLRRRTHPNLRRGQAPVGAGPLLDRNSSDQADHSRSCVRRRPLLEQQINHPRHRLFRPRGKQRPWNRHKAVRPDPQLRSASRYLSSPQRLLRIRRRRRCHRRHRLWRTGQDILVQCTSFDGRHRRRNGLGSQYPQCSPHPGHRVHDRCYDRWPGARGAPLPPDQRPGRPCR